MQKRKENVALGSFHHIIDIILIEQSCYQTVVVAKQLRPQ